MNQFNIIKIYAIFIQQQDTNSIQVPIDYKTRRHWNISKDIKQGAKFHGLKVLKSYRVCFLITGIILEIIIKRYLKINHIISSAMWHLPGEIFDLAIESLNEVQRLKKHSGWLQRRKHLNEKLIKMRN